MKSTLALFSLLAVILTACGGKEDRSLETMIENGDLQAIHAKKIELSTQVKALDKSIALLDSVIVANDSTKKLPLVTTIKVSKKPFNHFVELQGNVATKQNVLVYPQMAGSLYDMMVKEGQRVKKGQVLAKIDNGGMGNQLQQLKTQAELAETTFERQKRLWEQQIGTEMQYLQAKATYEAQVDAVRQLERQLDKFNIRAPFDGIVDDVIKDQGTIVSPGPGSEIFRIVNLSDMFIEVLVPESYVSTITPGKNVQVYFPVLNETIQSTVRQTGNFINPNNRSFTVEVAVPNKNGKIKPNLMAKVQINDYSNKSAILIPQSIISENAAGEQYTFVVSKVDKDNLAVVNKTIITTGKTQGDYVEVLSGIENEFQVIQEGARSVKDGQQVKILAK